jgi:RNA polymerase sigma factor (sigma-70 family)
VSGGKRRKTLEDYSYDDLRRLIGRVAARLHARFPSIPLDDLFQEGWVLCLSLRHQYDPTRNTAFSTWLVWVLTTRLLDYVEYHLYRAKRNWSIDECQDSVPLCSTVASDVVEAAGSRDILEQLRLVLSPLAWRLLQIKIAWVPRQAPSKECVRELNVNERTLYALSKEIQNGMRLILGG